MTRLKQQWSTLGFLLFLQVIVVKSLPTGLQTPEHNDAPLAEILVNDNNTVLMAVIDNSTVMAVNDNNTVLMAVNDNNTVLMAVNDNSTVMVVNDNNTVLSELILEAEQKQTDMTPIVTCNKEEVDILAENVQKLCLWVSDIDEYVERVFSRNEVSVPSVNDARGYKDIIFHYNDHVKTSKDHCVAWRSEDGIVSSLKHVVEAAQKFAPKFMSDFEKTIILVTHLVEDHVKIDETEAKIVSLEYDVMEAKDAATLTNDTNLLAHLESFVKRRLEQIEKITSEEQLIKARQELEALTHYLDGVRHYSAQVEIEAEAVRSSISNFRDDTLQDATTLRRHRTNAQNALKSITEERENNNQVLANNEREKNNLETQIAQERNQIATMNAQIQTAQRELALLEESIARGFRQTRKKKRFGRIFRVVVPVVGWVAGTKMVNDAKRKERELANQKRAYIQSHTQIVQGLHAQIAVRHQEIVHYQSRIANNIAKSRQLEEELETFNKLDSLLLSIEAEADQVLPYIEKAATSMAQMKNSYELVKRDLATIIERAKEAKSDIEISNVKYFIYNEIDSMKCKWEEAQAKINMVDKCH